MVNLLFMFVYVNGVCDGFWLIYEKFLNGDVINIIYFYIKFLFFFMRNGIFFEELKEMGYKKL